MSDNTAILAGYTRELIGSGLELELHIFVKPTSDLEGTFKAYDADNCAFIHVNGWLFTFQDIWSGHPDPSDPDNYWIDDKSGERVAADSPEKAK